MRVPLIHFFRSIQCLLDPLLQLFSTDPLLRFRVQLDVAPPASPFGRGHFLLQLVFRVCAFFHSSLVVLFSHSLSLFRFVLERRELFASSFVLFSMFLLVLFLFFFSFQSNLAVEFFPPLLSQRVQLCLVCLPERWKRAFVDGRVVRVPARALLSSSAVRRRQSRRRQSLSLWPPHSPSPGRRRTRPKQHRARLRPPKPSRRRAKRRAAARSRRRHRIISFFFFFFFFFFRCTSFAFSSIQRSFFLSFFLSVFLCGAIRDAIWASPHILSPTIYLSRRTTRQSERERERERRVLLSFFPAFCYRHHEARTARREYHRFCLSFPKWFVIENRIECVSLLPESDDDDDFEEDALSFFSARGFFFRDL